MSIINPIWFYLIDVLKNLKSCLSAVKIISAIALVIISAFFIDELFLAEDDIEGDGEQIKNIKKTIKKLFIVVIASASLNLFIPNEETFYKMIIAKNVTYENLDKASEVIKDSVDYIFDKMNNKEVENDDWFSFI